MAGPLFVFRDSRELGDFLFGIYFSVLGHQSGSFSSVVMLAIDHLCACRPVGQDSALIGISRLFDSFVARLDVVGFSILCSGSRSIWSRR